MLTKEIEDLIKEPLKEMGYFLISVKLKKIEGKKVLEITIDKDEGISLKDCEKASKLIEKILDEKDLIQERYYLAVYSKGFEE